MNWIILIFAGLCEVGFAYCLGRSKAVSGYEWWTWIAAFAAFYVLSAVLLAKATHTDTSDRDGLPCMDGHRSHSVLVGIFVFREPATFWRVFFLTTLIASIVGLKTIS